jgi:DNA-binding NarL/FixJ family response regulator
MTDPIHVSVHATDPVSEAGIVGQLRSQHDLAILPIDSARPPEVAVVAADLVDEHTIRMIHRARHRGQSRVVVIVGRADGGGVLAAVDAGVTALLRRTDATCTRLVEAIRVAASGDGMLPPDLLGRLLAHDETAAARPAPAGPRLTFGGLTPRELTVLRLVADGYSTSEIAGRLAYSERTIKNALHDLTSRLQLRNRSHAVAFALREGLI